LKTLVIISTLLISSIALCKTVETQIEKELSKSKIMFIYLDKLINPKIKGEALWTPKSFYPGVWQEFVPKDFNKFISSHLKVQGKIKKTIIKSRLIKKINRNYPKIHILILENDNTPDKYNWTFVSPKGSILNKSTQPMPFVKVVAHFYNSLGYHGTVISSNANMVVIKAPFNIPMSTSFFPL